MIPCSLSKIESLNKNVWQLMKVKNIYVLLGCVYGSYSNEKEKVQELINLKI